jgi:hypothetical protein
MEKKPLVESLKAQIMELQASIAELQMDKMQIDIKYSILYRKTMGMAVSFNKYVEENPKEEYDSDDEYNSSDESDESDESDDSDDEMTPFKDNMKPDDYYPKTDAEIEAIETFRLY